jgi:pimeloyl-ACP methyl ester carboxylesterase
MTQDRPDKRGISGLHRTVCGDGPVLLLLHGVTRCGADWEPLLPAFAQDCKVISLDQRGHGGSPRADGYLVTDYIADAVRFVRQEVSEPLVVFGHSLGAMVAAAVAAELPNRVRAIVLEDPPFHTMGNRIEGTAWQALFTGMREVARRGCCIEKMTDSLAEIGLPTGGGGFKRLGDLRDRASLAWSAECLSRLDPEVLTPVIEGRWLDGFDFPAALSHVRCPALLLQADPAAGGALTNADAETVRTTIIACHIASFPGCSHQLHRDHPAEDQRVVKAFVPRILGN